MNSCSPALSKNFKRTQDTGIAHTDKASKNCCLILPVGHVNYYEATIIQLESITKRWRFIHKNFDLFESDYSILVFYASSLLINSFFYNTGQSFFIGVVFKS